MFFPLFAIFITLTEVTPFSPPYHYEQQYQHSRREFQSRWERFSQNRTFTPWTPGRTKESIEKEFHQLAQLRKKAWFLEEEKLFRSHPDFAIAEELLHNDCVRTPECIPFAYNKACNYYNGSLVQTDSRRFLALMGPREKDVHSFFHLLLDTSASTLVRLTPAQEGPVSKCHPYWEGRILDSHLHIPFGNTTFPIPYFALDHWLDNQGTTIEFLLTFIQKVRASHDPASGPLAIHCTNGVGRTGTVIAAIALLDEIDHQLAAGIPPSQIHVSVEETVLRLSLQRFFMCGFSSQYENIYRLLERYTQRD